MAELRGAPLPSTEALNALASSLSGFPQAVIEKACTQLENSEPAAYAPRMPSLGELMEACRRASVTVKKSRFCGRCDEGRIRLGGQVVLCECCCRTCGGSGIQSIARSGVQYARNCPSCSVVEVA